MKMSLKITGDRALAIAWVVAFTSSLIVLFIGEVLGQLPCLLCWYQRVFMFPLPIIIGLGLWWNDRNIGRYSFAIALCGAAVALWHTAIYTGLISEAIQPCTASGPSCTDSNQVILGTPIPALSLFSFTIIAILSGLSLKDQLHE